ncbi:MAG: AAA family ATPase, partial [Actinobacteria bacterium]|nr:AAA family ATPase [Actinomycetota bacterium]
MRLHRLTVEAFGPFGGREEVDFDALSSSGLFLLSGPTGAGKTSVLDAVCFALFGEVPGARGEGRLGSDHRAPDATPRVVLEATVGGRRIRVTRSPKHERPPLRGGGAPVQEGATAKLELQDGEGWTAVAAKIPDVRHELDPLLGMTAEQFLQVVMLPQGAFATFLRADAKARQQVLERLFDAERFSKIEYWLQDSAREARAGVQAARVDADRTLSAAAGAWKADGEVPLLCGDAPATVDEVRAWIAAERARTATAAAEAEARRARAETERAQAEAAATAARALAERQDRRRRAEAELRKVGEHRAGRDKLAAELAAHRAAAPLLPYLNGDRAARAAAENAATELTKARRYVEALEDPELLEDPTRWASVARGLGEQAAGLQELREAEEALPARERDLARLETAVAGHVRRGEEAARAVEAGEA